MRTEPPWSPQLTLRRWCRGVRSGLLLAGYLLAHCAWAQAPVDISADPALAGPNISSNFSGLSYEISLVLPGKNGKYFFRPENQPLVQMFRTLGVKSLRVGGNSAERETEAIPSRADIDSLFAFARAAGVKVIYTLRLTGAQPGDDASIAKYVMEHYAPELTCFALGNEPEKMAGDYPAYREVFRRFLSVLTTATNVPEARFCGPSPTHRNASWTASFARDFAGDRRIVLATQHEYPARSGRAVVSAAAGCDKLLSPELLKVYEGFYGEFVPAVLTNGLAYRLEEANSFSNGGAANVSEAFAAALWGLDYLYWWAAHGAGGINFHTGGNAPGAQPRGPMKYAVFWNAGQGFGARPLAYGLKAFDLGGHGRLLPLRLNSPVSSLNLTSYAVLAPDGTLFLTLINKEHGPDRREAEINFLAGASYKRAQVMYLTAPGGDVAAKSGITLGGAAVDEQGNWQGFWAPLSGPADGGQFAIKLPAASAAVIKFTTD
jgi:hypothetical protein